MEHIINHAAMEHLTHPNQMFPLSEFVDYFDTFPDGAFPGHWHPELELQIVLEGCAQYSVNGSSYVVEKGCAIYIGPEAIHQARQLTPGTIGYNVVLDPRLLIQVMQIAHCQQYALSLNTGKPDALVITSERKEGYRILEFLRQMYYTETAQFSYELFLLERLIGLWRNLLALFPFQTAQNGDGNLHLREQRMKTMLDYIHQNYARSITVEEIASSAAVSQSECFRCFSRLARTTPVEYINQFRLLKASQLLLSTDRSMADICFSTGFNNTSYFSKKFKDQYGMTPGEYRRKKK
jgi:AraC-like DNA-binding protein